MRDLMYPEHFRAICWIAVVAFVCLFTPPFVQSLRVLESNCEPVSETVTVCNHNWVWMWDQN